MKTSVKSGHKPVSPRCAEIRVLLEDFAAERLGPTARGAVEGHLLTCDACSDALAELLMEKVDDGSLPLLAPPPLPSPGVYESYLRARRPQTSWRAVLEALDSDARDWATSRMKEISTGLALLVDPIGARGAMRTRGTVMRSPGVPRELVADVLTPAGEPSGVKVVLRVRTSPSVTSDGRFGFVVLADDVVYEGRRLLCTIALPNAELVSFESVLVHDGQNALRAVFEEAGLPAIDCSIPLKDVTVAIC